MAMPNQPKIPSPSMGKANPKIPSPSMGEG